MLDAVPPGDYELVAWHEAMVQEERTYDVTGGSMHYLPSPAIALRKPVRVTAGESSYVDFEFPAPPKKGRPKRDR